MDARDAFSSCLLPQALLPKLRYRAAQNSHIKRLYLCMCVFVLCVCVCGCVCGYVYKRVVDKENQKIMAGGQQLNSLRKTICMRVLHRNGMCVFPENFPNTFNNIQRIYQTITTFYLGKSSDATKCCNHNPNLENFNYFFTIFTLFLFALKFKLSMN